MILCLPQNNQLLTIKQQTVLDMKLEGMSNPEIARRLDISVQAVKGRKQRATIQLETYK